MRYPLNLRSVVPALALRNSSPAKNRLAIAPGGRGAPAVWTGTECATPYSFYTKDPRNKNRRYSPHYADLPRSQVLNIVFQPFSNILYSIKGFPVCTPGVLPARQGFPARPSQPRPAPRPTRRKPALAPRPRARPREAGEAGGVHRFPCCLGTCAITKRGPGRAVLNSEGARESRGGCKRIL